MVEQTTERAPLAQGFALVVGVVFLALGIAGFATAGEILGFHTGTVLNVVRTALGLLGLIAARRARTARVFGLVAFFPLLGITIWGLLSAGTDNPDDVRRVFDPHWADNALHGVVAVLGLVIFLLPARTRTTERV
ncbi:MULTISPECIES: DUF4383 domain-containing protein [Amycolatopsis]|uniref:DUF4383 domain-containing protein n=1 Tax=Amycolatopsis tucumanensis TaxID=401106 RepID=A0ABP7IRT8_9PSEU|nr:MULTISPECIES: DUF4383 domain-containing protein [Amycolatopsis]MCF6424772.1 DUF4383 domain-containing protein [Amycolatopsis tucumanensis]